jgi:hypothetical protein
MLNWVCLVWHGKTFGWPFSSNIALIVGHPLTSSYPDNNLDDNVRSEPLLPRGHASSPDSPRFGQREGIIDAMQM